MRVDTSNTAGNAALAVSSAGGIVTAINEYAVIIGLSLTLVSIVIGLVFHIRADRWRRRSAKNREELKRDILQELETKNRKECP